MKKLTPLFLSAAALVALSPEVANAATNPVDPNNVIDNSGDQADRTEERPQVEQPATPSGDDIETVEAVTTEDHIAEVRERREQDITAAVLDESSVEVDQVYHTPVEEVNKYRYEYDAAGNRLDDRDKNEVQVRFDVNDQSRLVNKEGQAGPNGAAGEGTVGADDGERHFLVETAADGTVYNYGEGNFKLVNRNDYGPQTINLNDFEGTNLINNYIVSEKEREDGTFDYSFDLSFRIPNNSISTVYDLIGTFIDENNNSIEHLISVINVVHQDDLVEIRDERTDPDVEAYKPKNETVPFQRVIKYVQHDEPVYVVRTAVGNYEVGNVVVPTSGSVAVGESGNITITDKDGNDISVYVKAYELNLGERITIRNGSNGARTVYYKQEFVNEEAVTDVTADPFRTVITRDEIDEILLVGSVITDVNRVSGDDRFKNSVQLSREGWNVPDADDADYAEKLAQLQSEWGKYGSHVFIANADKYADSLTGTPLAAANGAPILLTRGNTLNGAVADELIRLFELSESSRSLGQGTEFGVTILGGINSISNDVATAISTALAKADVAATTKGSYIIDRIGGIDRYHQAFLVADELARIKAEEYEELEALAYDRAESQLPSWTPDYLVERRAAEILADLEAEFEGTDGIYVASGDTFSDALAIAAKAGEYRNPVLLTRGNTLNEYARRFLEEHISEDSVEAVHLANVNIVGGTATISQTVANQINAILADKVAAGAEADGEQGFAGGNVNQDYYTNPLDFTPKPVTVGRIAGANRYEVSRNVNNGAKYTENETSEALLDQERSGYTHYLVVSGDHPSDALPASALANQLGYGVLLVSNNTQRAQEQLIAAIENGVTDFTFIGGVNTLSNDTFNIFEYSGDTIRAIIDGPGDFSTVINPDQSTDLLNHPSGL